jgi:hypothetical protein
MPALANDPETGKLATSDLKRSEIAKQVFKSHSDLMLEASRSAISLTVHLRAPQRTA